MTSRYERRITKLEAGIVRSEVGSRFLVVGLPNQPDPTEEEIAQADHVLRVRFIKMVDGQIVDARQ